MLTEVLFLECTVTGVLRLCCPLGEKTFQTLDEVWVELKNLREAQPFVKFRTRLTVSEDEFTAVVMMRQKKKKNTDRKNFQD